MHQIHRRVAGYVLTGILAMIGVALSAGQGWAQAKQQQVIVPNLLCPFGCGPTEADTMLNTMMARGGENVVMAAQETPGYMYNIRAMAEERRWKSTVFGTEDTVIQLAIQGGSPELKEFLPDRIPIKFKLLYGEAFWIQGKIFLTFDPNIKTMADLKGKRISIGLRGQSDWGVFSRLMLEHGYGITPKNSDIRHLNPAALTQQLIDGSTDVVTTAIGAEPNGKEWLVGGFLRQLEATGKKINYISLDETAIAKVNEKFGTTFLPLKIKAGTLPGQEKDILVGYNRGFKAAHETFPADVAYQVVKAVAKYAPQMKELHGLWRIWSPELMLHGLSEENVHPGAKKAYVELGWWDKRKSYPPMTYPSGK